MSALTNRLKAIEIKLKPIEEKTMIIRILRAGRDDDCPISFRNHMTGDVYAADDDLSHLKGYHVVMANYDD